MIGYFLLLVAAILAGTAIAMAGIFFGVIGAIVALIVIVVLALAVSAQSLPL